MFSGLFQTLLVPTRTPAEQETDAAAANGTPAVDAPAPAEGGVTSPPTPASELSLPAPTGNGVVAADPDARANPAVPAGIALLTVLAGVALVLAYPGHRARPQKAAAAPTAPPTVTGPARGAIAPLASTALLTRDPSQVKAAAAGAAPATKKQTPAKPAAKPAPSTGGASPSASAPADGSGSDSTGGTSPTQSPPSGSDRSSSQKKSSGTSKPAPLTAKGEWLSPRGDAQTLRFSFARSGSKSKVDQIQIAVMSGDSALRIQSYDVSKLPTRGACSVVPKRGPADMLRCPVSLSLGKRYELTVRTSPAPGIDTVGWLYGRIDGKIDPKTVIG